MLAADGTTTVLLPIKPIATQSFAVINIGATAVIMLIAVLMKPATAATTIGQMTIALSSSKLGQLCPLLTPGTLHHVQFCTSFGGPSVTATETDNPSLVDLPYLYAGNCESSSRRREEIIWLRTRRD